MTCTEVSPGVIICGPPKGIVCRRILMCHETCKRRTRHVVQFMGAWYCDRATCLACGDTNEDGYYYRPFRRGWRDEAKARARQQWDTAMTRREFDATVNQELRAELAYEGVAS